MLVLTSRLSNSNWWPSSPARILTLQRASWCSCRRWMCTSNTDCSRHRHVPRAAVSSVCHTQHFCCSQERKILLCYTFVICCPKCKSMFGSLSMFIGCFFKKINHTMFSFKKCTVQPRSKLNTNVTEIVWYRLLLLVLNISPAIFDKIINIHHRLQIGCDGNTRCLCSGHSSVTRFPLLMIHLDRPMLPLTSEVC